jgi:NADPH-dependent 2,4-dienoyl-CoA reductase/sulfur reductase-like enzyme
MMDSQYAYVIVGAGLAGVSAIAGIREVDSSGSILLVGREEELPYDRPPLSKSLWLGKKRVDEIHLHDRGFYDSTGVDLELGVEVAALDAKARTVTTTGGASCRYGKLLLATGGHPRRLDIPGGDLAALCYYRTIADYTRIREQAAAGKSAIVVGGGFIGSEMAAALHTNGVEITMVHGGPRLVDRVFPEDLGEALQADYMNRGMAVHARDVPVAFEDRNGRVAVTTKSSQEIEADFAIVGIGIRPETTVAHQAGLEMGNGIVVDEFQRTSEANIFAAGDVAEFPYEALGRTMRVEHWDHALNHGKQAGRNMAGAGEAYTYMPYFFSDLFEFGYEAVGEVDSTLFTIADWREKHKTGVLYYLADEMVRGIMLCNVWDKVEEARALIRAAKKVKPEELMGAIK